jgi:hypothetical protein
MMRLSRLRHLRRVEAATDEGRWCDLGRATQGLRRYFARHGLVEPEPRNGGVSWRDVKITPKGRESLRVAHSEYLQKRGGLT